MLGIVVFACGEGVEAASEPIYGRVEPNVIIIWKEDVKSAIQLGGGEFVEVLRDERDADEVGL